MKRFIRNFYKQKTVGLLNICSLSLGIMVATIIGLWALNELSFDNFHKDGKQIYHVVLHATKNASPIKSGTLFKPIGQDALEQLPQVKDRLRIYSSFEELKINAVYQAKIEVIAADENFFSFLNFPLKEGNPETVLSTPDGMVISETAAKQYFAEQNPIGQVMTINDHNFTITGLMKDMPANSSLQSHFVLPFYGYLINQSWGNNDGFLTLLRLAEDTDLRATDDALTAILYAGGPLFQTLDARCALAPLSELHYEEDFMGNDHLVKGNRSMILVLVLVAAIILIISCINFTNLFISTSFIRAKTVGIMKSHGADRGSLIRNFYAETACYTAVAVLVGLMLVVWALPLFNDFIGSRLTLDFGLPRMYLFISGLFLLTVLLAGTFPALHITRFSPAETLKGKFRGKQISFFQKSLIIVQFSASIALLIVVGFMQKQVHFMMEKNLGFDKENVIYVYAREHFGLYNYESLRDAFLTYPSITDVTAKASLPTKWIQGWGIGLPGSEESVIMEMNYISANYFDFMGMDIIDGENPFVLESKDSVISVVINESAARLLNLNEPVNKIIMANGYTRMIIKGVMKNAHIRSLRDEVDPQVYMKLPQWSPVYFFKYTGDPQQTIEIIRQKWEEMEPDFPFEYHFLDDTYRQLYTAEKNVGKVLGFAMLITLLISVAGLFAMAFYATQRRTKEIGLRKVNGATVKDLLLLLNRDFVIWVGISFLIATPIAYFGLQSWLEGFTVRTALSAWVFLLVGLIALAVTLITTSFQTWKVAQTNPVNTLKQE